MLLKIPSLEEITNKSSSSGPKTTKRMPPEFTWETVCLLGLIREHRLRGYLQECGCTPRKSCTGKCLPYRDDSIPLPQKWWNHMPSLPRRIYLSCSKRLCAIRIELHIYNSGESLRALPPCSCVAVAVKYHQSWLYAVLVWSLGPGARF